MDWRVVIAQHAAGRVAAVTCRQMARGLDGLATVAATAPFLGIVGTLCGIYGSFRGCGCEKTAYMAALMGFLSDAILPSAAGLAVAITASSCRKYLTARLDELDMDMRNAALEMPDYLTRLTGQ